MTILPSYGNCITDEVTEMPLEMQVKLLRVLETKSFRRVGGTEERDVDVRALLEERAHERGRDVRHAAGLGGHAVGHVAHAGRQVGDFGRDDEDARGSAVVAIPGIRSLE